MTLSTVIYRFRFTLMFLAIMLIANGFAGTYSGKLPQSALAAWGIGQVSVWSGEVWRLLTGVFLSHDRDMLLRQLVFAAGILGFTEWRRGSFPTCLLFFSLDFAATALLLLTIALWPDNTTLSEANDVGMSLGGFGLIGLALAEMRRRIQLLFAAFLLIGLKMAFEFDPLADVGHIVGLGMGFFLGLVQVKKSTVTRRKAD